jgi:hypothetical protein
MPGRSIRAGHAAGAVQRGAVALEQLRREGRQLGHDEPQGHLALGERADVGNRRDAGLGDAAHDSLGHVVVVHVGPEPGRDHGAGGAVVGAVRPEQAQQHVAGVRGEDRAGQPLIQAGVDDPGGVAVQPGVHQGVDHVGADRGLGVELLEEPDVEAEGLAHGLDPGVRRAVQPGHRGHALVVGDGGRLARVDDELAAGEADHAAAHHDVQAAVALAEKLGADLAQVGQADVGALDDALGLGRGFGCCGHVDLPLMRVAGVLHSINTQTGFCQNQWDRLIFRRVKESRNRLTCLFTGCGSSCG